MVLKNYPNANIQTFETYKNAVEFAQIDEREIIECECKFKMNKPQQLQYAADKIRNFVSTNQNDILPPLVIYTDSKYIKKCGEDYGDKVEKNDYENCSNRKELMEFRDTIHSVEDVYDELGCKDLGVSFVLFGTDVDGDVMI